MKTLIYLSVLLFALSVRAQGTVEALSNYSSPDGSGDDGTVGFGFMPYVNITVVEIGVFDSVVQQLESAVNVGLWNDAGTLIASESVSSLSPILNGTRYASLTTQQALQSYQNYYIAAYLPQVVGINLAEGGFDGNADISPAIRYLGWARVDSSTLTKPVLVPNGALVVPGVVNFQHLGVPVPEPGALTLVLLGFAALAFLRRRA